MSEYTLNIKKFNLNEIHDGAICTFIGKRKSGKSFCLRELMYCKQNFPIGKIISGTEEANPFFEDFFPKTFIDYDFKIKDVRDLILRQKSLLKKIHKNPEKFSDVDPRMLLVLDDCLYDNSWAKTKEIKNIFMNGRHYKIFFVITMQYVLGIPPILRTNIDYIFIYRDPSIGNRRRIYDNFCGMIPTFQMFCQVMDSLDKYECLVICNDADRVKLEDQLFWYKAKDRGPFKFGNERVWKINDREEDREDREEDKKTNINDYKPYNKSVTLNINKFT